MVYAGGVIDTYAHRACCSRVLLLVEVVVVEGDGWVWMGCEIIGGWGVGLGRGGGIGGKREEETPFQSRNHRIPHREGLLVKFLPPIFRQAKREQGFEIRTKGVVPKNSNLPSGTFCFLGEGIRRLETYL